MKKILLLILIINFLGVIQSNSSENLDFEKINFNTNEQNPGSATDKIIDFYKAQIKRSPDDYFNYNRVGELYIRKARETGQLSYYDKAEEFLNYALVLNSHNYPSYIYLGQVSSSRHDFAQTLRHAQKAIEINDIEDSAYGIMGDAYIELGKYEKAKKAYEKMAKLEPSLFSLSRLSHIKDIIGDTEGSINDMKKSISYGIRHRLPKENIAWAEVILGSIYFNKGDLKNAEIHYKKSLSLLRNYYLALEHIAELNAVKGNYKQAIKVYNLVLEINPNPDFHVAIADVFEKMGNKEKSREHYEIATDKYEYQLNSGFNGYLGHHARFYADSEIDLQKALQLAKRDLEIKKDVHAYDTLAWVYYKLGDYERALSYCRESLKQGTKDAGIYFHAGMINYKAGNFSDAKKYLDLSLKTNPYFDMNSPDQAKAVIKQISLAE